MRAAGPVSTIPTACYSLTSYLHFAMQLTVVICVITADTAVAIVSDCRFEMNMLQERCSTAENGLTSASHDIAALKSERDQLHHQVHTMCATACSMA